MLLLSVSEVKFSDFIALRLLTIFFLFVQTCLELTMHRFLIFLSIFTDKSSKIGVDFSPNEKGKAI